MSLLIKNGIIVTADGQFTGDILCRDGLITEIGPDLAVPTDSEVVDASGKYVFPGFIDPHVHIYLPFMGTFSKDDYASGSKAALMGGTTTLIEMCCPSRADDPREAEHSEAAGEPPREATATQQQQRIVFLGRYGLGGDHRQAHAAAILRVQMPPPVSSAITSTFGARTQVSGSLTL